MTQFEYLTQHVIPAGWHSVASSFRIWCDLMTNNWEGYALFAEDDSFKECSSWFWTCLGEDNIYSKKFIEDLEEIIKKIESGDEDLLDFRLGD